LTKFVNGGSVLGEQGGVGSLPFPKGYDVHFKEVRLVGGNAGGTAGQETRPGYIKLLICSGRVFYLIKIIF
jgi:hypothetical protein